MVGEFYLPDNFYGLCLNKDGSKVFGFMSVQAKRFLAREARHISSLRVARPGEVQNFLEVLRCQTRKWA